MLSDLVGVDRADVFKQGVLAAHLTRTDAGVQFAYVDEYRRSAGQAVAISLPLNGQTVVTSARSVPPYFAVLLPEGRRLTALRTALKTSADDDFSMLLAVGGDPIGDVQAVATDEPRVAFGGHRLPPVPWDEQSFSELFQRATGQEPDVGGISGVQDKVSGRMLSLPISVGNGSFLLKLDPPEYAHLVVNEAFFLSMARDCGIRTTAWRVVHDRSGRPGLLVQRFDRVVDADGSLRALACEDACQVLGRYPADKYALDTATVMDALAEQCASRAVALRNLMQQLVFALITGNGDLHAKNLSVLWVDGEWRVSPAYDLPSSYVYGDSTLAMAIGQSRQSQVSRKMLVALGEQLGLPPKATALIVDGIVSKAQPWLDRVGELPFDARRLHDLRRLMVTRLRLLARPGAAIS